MRLFGRTHHRIHAFILTLLSDKNDAEEVFQETNVIAWQKFDSFSQDSETCEDDFVRWVCTIARYQTLAFLKTRKPGRVVFSEAILDDLADRAMAADQQDAERRLALATCLDRLSEVDRDLFRQFYEEDSTAQQLADRLGKSAQAIYRVLHSIRRSLLVCIERSLIAR